MQPSIFVSCVTSEFGQTRSRVADVLMRLGYLPVKQEIFGTEQGDLRQVLRDKIDRCDGLIQIIGQGYGAEPPVADEQFGRVSYTQFEFLYARQQDKKTWLIFAGDACTRDNPPQSLDLPWDANHPDPVGYQAERRALQSEYRRQREQDGHLFHPALGDADLLLKVEQLKNELEQLRHAETQWRKKVSRALAALFALLVVIAVGIWWKSDDFMQWLYQDTKPTQSRVREHLVAREDKNYADALKAGEKIANPEERHKYLTDLEAQHQARIFRINALAENFESLDTGSHSSQVMEELASIISVQGEEAGLKYIEPLQTGIFERVKQRPKSAHKENRQDLYPLLIMALLQASRGDMQHSQAMFDEIIRLEPDWPDARYFYFWFLIAVGEQTKSDNQLDKSEQAFRKARETAEYALRLDPQNGQTKHDLVVVMNHLGDIHFQRKDYAQAQKEYESALKNARELADTIRVNPTGRREVSFALNRLGDIALVQEDYVLAESRFLEALKIADELSANDRSQESGQYDLMFTLRRLGDTSLTLNKLEQAKKYLGRSAQIADQFTRLYPGNTFYAGELVASLELLADAYTTLNELTSAEMIYDRTLTLTRDMLLTDQDNPARQRSVSVSLNRLGDIKKRLRKWEEAQKLATESIGVMETLTKADKENESLQRDLVVPLRLRANIHEMLSQWSEAETYSRRAHDVLAPLAAKHADDHFLQFDFTRNAGELAVALTESDKLDEARQLVLSLLPTFEKFSSMDLYPKALAEWQRNHSVALNQLATISTREKQFDQARQYTESALDIIRPLATREPIDFNLEQDHIYTLRLLSGILLEQEEFDDALESAREVLEIRERQANRYRDPPAQIDVAMAYFEMAKIANRKQDRETENSFLKQCYAILFALKSQNVRFSPLLEDLYPKLEKLFEESAERGSNPTLQTPQPAPM